jgi:hypothetical protein
MVGSYMAFDSSTRKRIMDIVEELSRRELLALREIHDVGRTTDPATALQLLAAGMIRQVPNDHFHLTDEGRRMLLRGSPSLWNSAA